MVVLFEREGARGAPGAGVVGEFDGAGGHGGDGLVGDTIAVGEDEQTIGVGVVDGGLVGAVLLDDADELELEGFGLRLFLGDERFGSFGQRWGVPEFDVEDDGVDVVVRRGIGVSWNIADCCVDRWCCNVR